MHSRLGCKRCGLACPSPLHCCCCCQLEPCAQTGTLTQERTSTGTQVAGSNCFMDAASNTPRQHQPVYTCSELCAAHLGYILVQQPERVAHVEVLPMEDKAGAIPLMQGLYQLINNVIILFTPYTLLHLFPCCSYARCINLQSRVAC